MRWVTIQRAAGVLLSGVGLFLLSGCTAAPAPRAEAPIPGGTWDSVMPAPATVVADELAGGPQPGPEYQRNDARLAAVGDPYPMNQWPSEPMPSAFYSRTLSMPSSASSTVLFRQRYSQYGRYWGGYWGGYSGGYWVRP